MELAQGVPSLSSASFFLALLALGLLAAGVSSAVLGGGATAGEAWAQAERSSERAMRAAAPRRPSTGDMGGSIALVITVPPMNRAARFLVLLGPCLLAAGLALSGCRESQRTKATPSAAPRANLRVFVLGGAAGAVEPCGCVADMLGGVDHAAAILQKGKGAAQGTLVLGAGPMFFQDPTLAPEAVTQARFKAETMAVSLRDLGLAAWAPGQNDWALGPTCSARCRRRRVPCPWRPI